MKIKSLEDIENLSLATSNEEVDDRVLAILELHEREKILPKHLVAEALVGAMGYVSYSEHQSKEVELILIRWIDNHFDEKDEKYIDSLATIYANMGTRIAYDHLKNKVQSLSNGNAKIIFMEAANEFQLRA